MVLRKLPAYVINKLKAGEVVERPASVLKELVENSLDAGADEIEIYLEKGGKKLIRVEDNGKGIEKQDLDLLFERYVTSKIYDFEDLQDLRFYGFRGEALATISEVSKITLITKTVDSPIAYKVEKVGEQKEISSLPFGVEHGTLVMVRDLFYNVPVRKKYLKSDNTEYGYCYNYFVNLSLINFDKTFRLFHNDKLIFDLKKGDLDLRIKEIFGGDLLDNLSYFEKKIGDIEVFGYISSPNIRYYNTENMRVFVNKRFVYDKLVRKAVLEAYKNQLHPGEYPFLLIFLSLPSEKVDINVHPRKLEVKFLNYSEIYNLVFDAIKSVLSENKITTVDLNIFDTANSQQNFSSKSIFSEKSTVTKDFTPQNLFDDKIIAEKIVENYSHDLGDKNGEVEIKNVGKVKIVGQLRDLYIILEAEEAVYFVDQHALAERIAFEKMKKNLISKEKIDLLSPITVKLKYFKDNFLDNLRKIGFEVDLLSENSIVVYKVPKILQEYRVDLQVLFESLSQLDSFELGVVLDKIFATKACKISIKAGEKLSILQMENLIKEGFKWIDGMFVCQHGRPFFIKFEKKKFYKLFDREV